MMYCVNRVSTNAIAPQLKMRRKVVNNLPAEVSGLTSAKPAVVTVMVVMYKASMKLKCSISM